MSRKLAPGASAEHPSGHRREEKPAGAILTLEVDLRRGDVHDEHDLFLLPFLSGVGDGDGFQRGSPLRNRRDGRRRQRSRFLDVAGKREGRGELRARAPVRRRARRLRLGRLFAHTRPRGLVLWFVQKQREQVSLVGMIPFRRRRRGDW